jgi:Glyoxalase-like domain
MSCFQSITFAREAFPCTKDPAPILVVNTANGPAGPVATRWARPTGCALVWIDHLVYGVNDLSAGIDAVGGRLGVRAEPGGQHVGLGTHNAILTLGTRTYLEIIAPDPEQPPPPHPRPFGLDDLEQPHLVGWAVGCDDIDAAVAICRANGYDPGDVVDMERARPAAPVLRWRLTRGGASGPVPFLIEWGGAEHPARAGPRGVLLERLDVHLPDPAGLVSILGALALDVTVTPASHPCLIAHLRGPQGMTTLD